LSARDLLAEEVIATALPEVPTRLGEWHLAFDQLNASVEEGALPDGVIGRSRRRLGSPAAITIDHRLPQSRRTFTAGHELAHLMLDRSIVVTALGDRLPTRTNDIESLCDAIAGALLVPKPWVTDLPSEPPLLGQLLRTARRFGISPSVFAIRLASLNRNCLLLRARKSGPTWEWLYQSGGIAGLRTAMLDSNVVGELGKAGSWSLGSTGMLVEGRRAAEGECRRCHGSVEDFVIDVDRADGAAFVWIRPVTWCPRLT
jgi:uncharacterized protein DUF955